jgi:hypothetical protein
MNVGLIDVDNWGNMKNCFPNLPLMKISSFYKRHDHSVEWYEEGKDYDLVFKSKVFSFTPDIPVIGDVVEVRSGGSGYFIHLKDGKEVFDKECHRNLIDQIEHSYPDYGLYGITNTAFGFMSRGCPRGCHFCHVEAKEGRRSYKVADLSEFWSGQKKIELMDPNTFACKDWKDILTQLINSGSLVNFNQGVDVRILNSEKVQYLQKVKLKHVHFAFDRFEDWDIVTRNLLKVRDITGWRRDKVSVYILTNFNTTFEQDLKRCLFVRDVCGFQPYVMRYDKEHIPRGADVNALARWMNWKQFCWTVPTFEDYKRLRKEGKV